MNDFIPATMEREIYKNIVFRPIRSWHSNTYAGERLKIYNGDRSGCEMDDMLCRIPYTVTHRLYWNKNNPEKTISAFLSYPNGMGNCANYFWEIYPAKNSDIERFSCELRMEEYLIGMLKDV